jgi:hypothetical protein
MQQRELLTLLSPHIFLQPMIQHGSSFQVAANLAFVPNGTLFSLGLGQK